MVKGKKKRKGKRRKGEGLSDDFEVDNTGGEITLGWEKAGIGAAVTFSEETISISLGIGVAAVELDLGELNNSSVSYAFDLYTIDGYRDGCTVTLEYRIAGTLVKTENRRIPDCNEDKKQEKEFPFKPPPLEDKKLSPENSLPDIPGNPWDMGYWFVGYSEFSEEIVLSNTGHHHYGRVTRRKRTSSGEIYQDPYTKRYLSNAVLTNDLNDKSYAPGPGSIFHLTEDYIFDDPYTYTGRKARTLSSWLQYNPPYSLTAGGASFYRGYLFGTKWELQKYLINITNFVYTAPYGESISTDDGETLQNSHYWKRVLALSDYYIIEKGPPPRGGGNNGKSRRQDENPGEKMDKKCCKMIAEIYDVLAPDEMIDEGFNIPTSLFTPKGRGNKKLNNYLEVLDHLYRTVAHFGVGPFAWKLKDSNLAKKGNQELTGHTINGTDAIREILQSVKKGSSENEGLITATGSIMIALEQIATITTEGTRIIREVFQFLGIPVKSQNFKLRLPFNTGALYKKVTRKGKGKNKNSNQATYELNTTESSNTLLPKMLTQKEKEYELEVYDDDYPNLIEQLSNNQINNNANN